MKKILFLALSFVFAVSAFCQTYKAPLKLTSPRTNGPEVLVVQERLIDLGFTQVGTADGWFGPLTKDAVSSFQSFYGYTETGIVDLVLWNTLFTDSKKQLEIEDAIRSSNSVSSSKLAKSDHDIMGRSTEGGHVDQYLQGTNVILEDFWFYGEMGKVEYKVIHLASGLVVLQKEYQYPEPFDLDHATIENTAFYFVGKTSVKAKAGKIEKSDIKKLPIFDLIGKTGT